MSVATSSAQAPLEALSGGDALIGMAALGKTAAALALVIAIILLCTSLLKRCARKTGSNPRQRISMFTTVSVGVVCLSQR